MMTDMAFHITPLVTAVGNDEAVVKLSLLFSIRIIYTQVVQFPIMVV